ncbi:hypothetical protein ACLOJK_008071 [Asimina triloba]
MRSCPGGPASSAHARRSRARRSPFSSAHLLRRSDSASVDLPRTYDRRQRLPRRLLHSRAPSPFSLVSLSLSTTSSTVSPFPTSTAVSVSPGVFSIPDFRRRFPLSLSLSLHNVFSGRPIPDLDRRQRLPRRLLHSRPPLRVKGE